MHIIIRLIWFPAKTLRESFGTTYFLKLQYTVYVALYLFKNERAHSRISLIHSLKIYFEKGYQKRINNIIWILSVLYIGIVTGLVHLLLVTQNVHTDLLKPRVYLPRGRWPTSNGQSVTTNQVVFNLYLSLYFQNSCHVMPYFMVHIRHILAFLFRLLLSTILILQSHSGRIKFEFSIC